MLFKKIFAAALIALAVLVIVPIIYQNQTSNLIEPFTRVRNFRGRAQNVTTLSANSEDDTSQFTSMPADKLLGGLLSPGFHETSCLSRYQSSLYRKTSPHKPSPYIISKLRSYEDLHKRCGPHTKAYNRTLKQFKSGQNIVRTTKCNYLVWIAHSGLGNRILTMTSAFLYALLTNRVLLIDHESDMADLFCEPFPNTTWLLPMNFPLKKEFNSFDQKHAHCLGNLLKENAMNTSIESPPSYLYLHLVHDYDDHDKLFFCDQYQALLQKVPWLITKSDIYFIPSVFLMTSFEQELSNLFPEKETVFHHLGRYLFHPSNQVWGLITRFYEAYLAKADERIGIQIRVFEIGNSPFQYVMDQILACTLKEKLLPEVDTQKTVAAPSKKKKLKAVLITSLISGYYENISTMYWTHPTNTGEVIEVYQPSHEEYQHTENNFHNMKAWAEMYLLSLSDALVTSSWSTFGYVAQGLGGLKPWILYKPENQTAPDPPCRRAMSMEPCFHAPPIFYCKSKFKINTLAPHVRHCEDMSWGLKLVNSYD